MTQGAMGNLINRYRAVLRKCRVKNAMNRIVLAGALLAAPLFAEGLSSVTGGTGTVWAATYSLDNQANDFAHTGAPQSDDAKSSGRTGTVGTEHAGESIYGHDPVFSVIRFDSLGKQPYHRGRQLNVLQ